MEKFGRCGFEVKVAVWPRKAETVYRKPVDLVGLTCVPDVLDPYVGTGSKEQPLDGDEEEAEDV